MNHEPSTTTVPRVDLPRPIPARICRRPVGALGVPVPYYAAVGSRGVDLAAWSMEKIQACVKDRRCALCGGPLVARLVIEGEAGKGWAAKYGASLGQRFAMVLTPLEAVRRETRFLPAHQDCATWWGKAGSKLPVEFGFWAKREVPNAELEMLNTELLCVWTTRDLHVQGTRENGVWVSLGEPETVTWWLGGRAATQGEAAEGITQDVLVVVGRLRKRKDAELREALRVGMLELGRWLPKKEADPQISPMDAEEDLRS